MKKWMILAAAILVVLGIGFAVKGASDKKQGATPEGTAVTGDGLELGRCIWSFLRIVLSMDREGE